MGALIPYIVNPGGPALENQQRQAQTSLTQAQVPLVNAQVTAAQQEAQIRAQEIKDQQLATEARLAAMNSNTSSVQSPQPKAIAVPPQTPITPDAGMTPTPVGPLPVGATPAPTAPVAASTPVQSPDITPQPAPSVNPSALPTAAPVAASATPIAPSITPEQTISDRDSAAEKYFLSHGGSYNGYLKMQLANTDARTKMAKLTSDQLSNESKNFARAGEILEAAEGADPSQWGTYRSKIIQYDPDLEKILPNQKPSDQDLHSYMGLVGYYGQHLKTLAEAQKPAETAASTLKTSIEATGQQRTQLAQDLSAVGNDAGKLESLRMRTKDPAMRALIPATVSDVQDTVKALGVSPKDQPEYQIKKNEADAMSGLLSDPKKVDELVDNVISPTTVTIAGKPYDTSALNQRVKGQVREALKLGLPMTAINATIKDASDQIGRTESGVRTAEATAPIKISIAAQTPQAIAGAAGETEDDFKRAGQQYAITGVMPPMGRGAFERGKIMHYSQEYARENGLSPRDLSVAQAAFAGDKKSLEKFQANRDQIVSFEQTAQKNLDQFLGVAEKIPDTGIPWINKPLRELDSKIIGSENMAAVNAARQVANNEIAKVTSGGGLSGVLSDTARKEVSGYNPADATFAQTKAVAKILKQDMSNRHQSMDAMIGEIKNRIGTPSSSSAAPKVEVWKRDANGKLVKE